MSQPQKQGVIIKICGIHHEHMGALMTQPEMVNYIIWGRSTIIHHLLFWGSCSHVDSFGRHLRRHGYRTLAGDTEDTPCIQDAGTVFFFNLFFYRQPFAHIECIETVKLPGRQIFHYDGWEMLRECSTQNALAPPIQPKNTIIEDSDSRAWFDNV